MGGISTRRELDFLFHNTRVKAANIVAFAAVYFFRCQAATLQYNEAEVNAFKIPCRVKN